MRARHERILLKENSSCSQSVDGILLKHKDLSHYLAVIQLVSKSVESIIRPSDISPNPIEILPIQPHQSPFHSF